MPIPVYKYDIPPRNSIPCHGSPIEQVLAVTHVCRFLRSIETKTTLFRSGHEGRLPGGGYDYPTCPSPVIPHGVCLPGT